MIEETEISATTATKQEQEDRPVGLHSVSREESEIDDGKIVDPNSDDAGEAMVAPTPIQSPYYTFSIVEIFGAMCIAEHCKYSEKFKNPCKCPMCTCIVANLCPESFMSIQP